MIQPPAPSNLFRAMLDSHSGSTNEPVDRLAFATLLAANILPILLALGFGWDVGDVVTFYWLENIIIGLWVIPRLLTAQGETPIDVDESKSEPTHDNTDVKVKAKSEKYFIVPFFCFHYFMFCFVHGVFVRVFASGALTGKGSAPLPFDTPEGGSWPGPLAFVQFFYLLLSNSLSGLSAGGLLAVTGLMISHGVSYFRNYIGHGEYKRTHAIIEMFRPYPRIIVLHLGIIIGGIATLLLGSPLLLVVILMIGKTILDAKLHLAGHTMFTSDQLSPRQAQASRSESN
jgi:hypothetical protein